MRLTFRQKPIIKSTVYAVLCLLLLLFSHSFFPALRLTVGKPYFLCGVVASLAYYEGLRYAAFFGIIFGTLEAMMSGNNAFLFPVFYVGFAFLCTWLFESFFTRNFVSWSLYTAGGLVSFSLFSLFAPVFDWGISAAELLLFEVAPSFLLSALFSAPLYVIFGFLKKKTDKER